MNKYMKRADELASENLMTNDGGPFGACIVRNGKIIGEGRNTVLRDNDPTAHAEVNAIRNACSKLGTHDLSGAAVYTSRKIMDYFTRPKPLETNFDKYLF